MNYLPVFLDLSGRRVLVVGGGDIARRKVELLLAAGARVLVVAPELNPQLLRDLAAGRIEHVPTPFCAEHMRGVRLAIAATDDAAVNAAVAHAGEVCGVFVNAVDDRANSSCILPAIIDRSPVIVAVGTAGSSPVLARRLRAQIEALLPQRLGELASLAARWRERVRRALPQLRQRRRFWERVLDSPIETQVLSGNVAAAEALLEAQLAAHGADATAAPGPSHRGEVYLIGAGPGDPELLTLRALQLLQQADVVLYDRLVSPAVLARARRDAERIYVGKQAGESQSAQARIHALMLQHAAQGQRVARLKGGDPFIFGRGGEELQELRRAGVAVVIVPGITAALGAAAACGLPLTQRGQAQALTLVTVAGSGAEQLDWRALAAPLQTVVFYMSIAALPRIVAALRGAGAPGERGAVVVASATLATQRSVVGTLTTIESLAREAQLAAPALLVVGEVVSHLAHLAHLGQATGQGI